MDFYTILSEYYDLLFVPSPEQREWAAAFASGGPLLDAGCATGELACALAKGGIEVSGFDSDPEMIRIARTKALTIPARPDFRVDSLEHCAESYPRGGFRSLLCLGNTLVHLAGRAEVNTVMRNFHALLAPGGRLAVQLLNYDRLLLEKPAGLPPLTGEDERGAVSFYRSYSYDTRGVRFSGRLRIEHGGEREEYLSETRLLAIRGGELLDSCTGAGFRSARLWEDYERTPATDDSFFYLLSASAAL
jgi:glycine/sarcosine N-methyltransferase